MNMHKWIIGYVVLSVLIGAGVGMRRETNCGTKGFRYFVTGTLFWAPTIPLMIGGWLLDGRLFVPDECT